MGVLEGFALGMQYLFLGMLFVFGAVIYSVVVFSLVDEEHREKWLFPIPLTFGLAVLLILPALFGWVGWALYFACVGAWMAVIIWQHPPLREPARETLVWLWDRAEAVMMPKRFAAKVAKAEAEERAEIEAREAEKLRWQALKEAQEQKEWQEIMSIRRHNERILKQQLLEADEREKSGKAELEREAKADAARKAEAEAQRRAEEQRRAEAEVEAKAKAERRATVTEDEDGFPMF